MKFPLDDRELNKKQSEKKARSAQSKKAGDRQSIGRATLVTMLGMLLAKATGFIRELLIVPKFGYGLFSDAYINAFQIPDLIYQLLIGGAVAAVITPHLASGIEKGREKEAWKSVSILISWMLVATAVCLGLAEAFATPLMGGITGGFKDGAAPGLKEMTLCSVPVMRILLLQTFKMVMISACHGVLHAYKRFTATALGPVVYNLFYILALVCFGEESAEGIQGVAWGVVGASFVYFLTQALAARSELSYYRFSLDRNDRGFQRLLRLAIPTILSGSVLHLNSIIMNRFANGLECEGAVTSIRQCITTWSLPYAIFTVSVGTVMLPNLSGFVAQGDDRRVRNFYTECLRRALYLVTPFALAFYIMRFDTIRAIFQWNAAAYPDAAVAQTAEVLKWFCISMVAQTFVFLTNQAFYARKITRITLLTGILALIFNPLFCLLFLKGMGMGLEGIGMAHAVYSVLTACMLYHLYKIQNKKQRPLSLLPFMQRLVLCCLVSGFVFFSLEKLPPLAMFEMNKFMQLLGYVLKLFLGLFAYYASGIAIGFGEAVKLQKKLRSFFHLPPAADGPLY